MVVKENATPKDPHNVQSTDLICFENFDKATGVATPPTQPRPHQLATPNENLLKVRTMPLPHQSRAASEQFGPKVEMEQLDSDEDSWDSVIDGPVSSQLLEQHKMCEDSLVEILNCDTDDFLAKIWSHSMQKN